MSCPTAKLWLLPDHEYYAITEDYALVRRSSALVDAQLSLFDRLSEAPAGNLAYENYDQYDLNRPDCFDLGRDPSAGIFVYADVDSENPAHKLHLDEVEAKIPRLQELPEKLSTAVEALGQAIRKGQEAHFGKLSDHEVISIMKDEIRGDNGFIHGDLLRALIKFEDKAVLQNVLTVLSGQAHRKNPRPVMLLIDIIYDPSATISKPRKGIAVGYEFLSDKIILKSFNCTRKEHPLARSWFRPGIGYDFLQSATAESYISAGIASSTMDKDPIVLLARRIAGSWVRINYTAWDFAAETTLGLDESLKSIGKTLRETPFPARERPAASAYRMTTDALLVELEELRLAENDLRAIAIHAHEGGLGNRAESVAKYFETSVKALQQMIEDPEALLDFSNLSMSEFLADGKKHDIPMMF